MEKGNALSDPGISLKVEKVISDDREIAETFNDSFCKQSSQSKSFAERKLRHRCRE